MSTWSACRGDTPLRLWLRSPCHHPRRVARVAFRSDTYRKQAVDTLMELCDAQTHRQFLFITPQDMFPFLRHREKEGKSMPQIIRMQDVR